MEDLAVSDDTVVGSEMNYTGWDKGKKNHLDWPLNAEISIRNYLLRTVAKYSKAIKVKPDQSKAYYCRGTAKYQLDDYQGAINDFSKAIDLKPAFADAYLNRAWAHFMHGEKIEALADLQRASELGYPVVKEAFDIFQQAPEHLIPISRSHSDEIPGTA